MKIESKSRLEIGSPKSNKKLEIEKCRLKKVARSQMWKKFTFQEIMKKMFLLRYVLHGA